MIIHNFWPTAWTVHFFHPFTELHSMKRCRLWKQICQPNLRNSNSSRKITKPANLLVLGVKLQQQQMLQFHSLLQRSVCSSQLWGNISCVLLSWFFPGSDFLYRGVFPHLIYKETKVNRTEPAAWKYTTSFPKKILFNHFSTSTLTL